MSSPNILLITTDQQRFDTIHAMGNSVIKTPNLDRLVQEGCVFTNAYSPNPVCIPARHNMITGLGARHHGLDDNYFDNSRAIPPELPTFAQILTDDTSYDAMAIGKMHFLPCRRHNGFSNMKLMEEIPVFPEDDAYTMYLKEQGYGHLRSVHGVRHLLYMQPQQSLLPEEHHGSHWVADETINYIEKIAKKRPFLAWSSFIAPHPPLDVPERYAQMYKDVELPELSKSITPLSNIAKENGAFVKYPDPSYLKRVQELYYGAISFVDYNIGRILDTLEEQGILDDTVIIFTSDHGEMLGDKGTYQKFLPYDESAKIPMIIRYPKKVQAGTVREDFVDLNDLFPTILDFADKAMPTHLDYPGESLFAENPQKNREYQYLEHCKGNRRWISLRNQAYKFNYYYSLGQEELFDMQQDPKETTNLLHGTITEEIKAIRDELYAKLATYEERYGLHGYAKDGVMEIMDEYKIQNYEEMNFPKHLDKLSEEELAQLWSTEEEILRAVEHEELVDLTALDLTKFRQFSGLSEAAIGDMLERAKQLNRSVEI